MDLTTTIFTEGLIIVTSFVASVVMMIEAIYLRNARGDLSQRVRFRNAGGAITLFVIIDYAWDHIQQSGFPDPRDYFLAAGTTLILAAMLAPRKDIPLHPDEKTQTWVHRVERRFRHR